jgi:formate hydrogenlyase subunit 4
MSVVLAIIAQLVHVALTFAAALLLVDLIEWMKSRLLGRTGPPLGRLWRDLHRLARKQPVIAENASPLFLAAPYVAFAAVATAASLTPSFATGMVFAPLADLLVIAGLLALACAVMALAAMDVGTAIGGGAASRTISYAALAQPALFLVLLTFGLLAGTTNLDAIAETLREGAVGIRASLGMALVSLMAIAIAQMGRSPAANANTRCEPAMLSEAAMLEYSGRDLALLEATDALRLALWLSLIAVLVMPYGVVPASAGPLAWLVGIVLWAAKLVVLGCGLAVLECGFAVMRTARVPELLGAATLLGLLALAFLFASQGLV